MQSYCDEEKKKSPLIPNDTCLYETSEEYLPYRAIQGELDELITSLPEVEEGILTCPKCQCTKTLVIQKQIRRADEGFTLFAKCCQCKYQWRDN